MIKANELRLGNIVHANTPNMIVQAVNKYEVELYMPGSEADNFTYPIEQIEGVNLTPAILKNAGFLKVAGVWSDTKIDLYEGGKSYLYLHSNLKVKYLHSLQNLVFELTGREVTIKF